MAFLAQKQKSAEKSSEYQVKIKRNQVRRAEKSSGIKWRKKNPPVAADGFKN